MNRRTNPSRAANSASLQAFTLIELMVVMVLIGILSAAILPAMRGTYEDALLRSTGREIVNVFELAYSRAVSLNQIHRVRIEETTGRYVLEQPAREGGQGFAPVSDVAGSAGTLDSRIAISFRAGNNESKEESPENRGADPTALYQEGAFSFYPDGTADPGEIQLQDRDGFRLVLRIDPVTARVRVLEAAKE